MMHSGYLDTSKATSDGIISKTSNIINDDLQAIIVDMAKVGYQEVNTNFGRASRGEKLRESYTLWIALCEIKLSSS